MERSGLLGLLSLGGISVGLQVGAESDPIAMVLNNAKAASKFLEKSNV